MFSVRKTRTSGLAVVDYLPGAKTKMEPEPMMRYFVDPAPTAINLYADLLKIIDSSGQRLPFELTDLPSPEFVGGALSRFGVEFSMNPYFVSLDLHSPTGIAIPLVVGASVAMQMQQQQQRRSRPAVGVGTVH